MIKIRPENMIYFITVCGFFIGMMFSIVNTLDPVDIILYTLEITLFFYLLSHVAVMNFSQADEEGRRVFNRKEYENVSAYFIHEIEEREARMGILLRPEEEVVQSQVVKRKKRHDGSDKKEAS